MNDRCAIDGCKRVPVSSQTLCGFHAACTPKHLVDTMREAGRRHVRAVWRLNEFRHASEAERREARTDFEAAIERVRDWWTGEIAA